MANRLLIATDEAGYGPKLGPMVICATAWVLPDVGEGALPELFAPLSEPHPCGDVTAVVNDSKAVFKPGSGLSTLHAVVSASQHWINDERRNLVDLLDECLDDEDRNAITGSPWLCKAGDACLLDSHETGDLRDHWAQTGVRLVDAKTRIITAREFNRACASGYNKADLLSESTLQLAKQLISRQELTPGIQNVDVFCDRHGGRRYYASVLQHVFADHQVQVVDETKSESSYCLNHDTEPNATFRFTVKGDSFAPVALSSIHAKYLRERCMECFNEFFADNHRGGELKPTAGYPVDAERFLAAVEPTIKRLRIDRDHLIRSR